MMLTDATWHLFL